MIRGALSAAKVYLDPRMAVLLGLGFSSGLPRLLIYSTLTFWLMAEGLSITAVGFFAAVSVPYRLKFLWSPIIDRVPIPILSRLLGQRRSWLLATQLALAGSISALAMSSPGVAPTTTALLALLVAFCSASQDVVVDAYRVERLETDEQGAGAAVAVFGYRVAMFMAGAIALYLAAALDSWPLTYFIMAALMGVGIFTTLICAEPKTPPRNQGTKATQARDALFGPFIDIFKRKGWPIFLSFVLFYKLGEALGGAMRNPFLVDIGFEYEQIANVAQTFGLIATIVGIFIGGYVVRLTGVVPALFIGGVLQMTSNFMYVVQNQVGADVTFLVLTIGTDNLSGGLGTAALVAYLSGLCRTRYTATQYALLTALTGMVSIFLTTGSGAAAQWMGWSAFYAGTAFAALPGILLLWWMMARKTTGLLENPDELPPGVDDTDGEIEAADENQPQKKG